MFYFNPGFSTFSTQQASDPRDAITSSFSFPPRQGRGPQTGSHGFGSQSRVRKLSDPCGCHWPTSEWCSEPLRVFFFFFVTPAPSGTPSGCCHLCQTPKCLQNSTIKSKSSVGNAGSLNKPCIPQRGSVLDLNWRGSLGFNCFMWLCFFDPLFLNMRANEEHVIKCEVQSNYI